MPPRIVTLPESGTLLAATDLHGNLPDFQTLIKHFDDDTTLVICGDLVHGPNLDPLRWPDYLGDYYVDETKQLLGEAFELQQRFPDRVHYLMGNHEHAHVGGRLVAKFHPDEATALEKLYAPGEFEPIREWMAGWPRIAVAPRAGIVFTHGAPHGMSDKELLWSRTTSSSRAFAFLEAVHPGAKVAMFGHDPIREGHLVEREPLLCVSTSFGCHDGDKVFLRWDLATPAGSAAEVARHGLQRLHPGAPRRYRPADEPATA
jgi:hypothetical protein